MPLSLYAAPSEEPVTLAEARHHVRRDDAADDSLLTGLIVAARRWCERYTSRQFVTATWTLNVDCFPKCGLIELPYPPLASVVHVKYYDAANQLQTLSSNVYQVDAASQPGRLLPVFGAVWPQTYRRMNAVEIQYTAGYGAATAVPQTIKQAILLLVGHWSENREGVLVGSASKEIEFAVKSLLGVECHGSLEYQGV